MRLTDANRSFGDALEILRAGYDDTYEDWGAATVDVLDVARDEDLDAAEVVTYPGVQQAIWRYQHHDADTVRRQIDTAIEREGYDVTVDQVVAALITIAGEMSENPEP